jgi:hypothetical protein
MLLLIAGLLLLCLEPQHWIVAFTLVSLAYAMACSALWILPTEFVPVPSLGLAFSITHAFTDVLIMIWETQIGRLLDEGKTFQTSVLPIMVGFGGVAALATLLLMFPLHKRAQWNAALAEACAGAGAGGGGGVGKSKSHEDGRQDSGLVLGSLGTSLGGSVNF